MIAAPTRPPFRPTPQAGQLSDTIRGRARYPYTICGSTEHLDSFHRQDNLAQRSSGILAKGPTIARPGVRVHFADQDKENAPEEELEVDEQLEDPPLQEEAPEPLNP
jgi:hypothetical protein